MQESSIVAQDVLEFWFGHRELPSAEKKKTWFFGSDKLDATIRELFEETLDKASQGHLDHWAKTDEGLIALVIVLDQFPRNMYRKTPRSFAYDEKALAITHKALELGRDETLPLFHRMFLYLPLEHSETMSDQELSLQKFRDLADDAPQELKAEFERTYNVAVMHYRIIEQWGRYPHRNEILGRTASEEEINFLKTPHSSFL